MNWLEIAQEFQTAIVGLIGFTGVIASQLINGRLARARDAQALQTRRLAVTTAFEVELRYFREFFLGLDPEAIPKNGELALRPRSKRIVTPALMGEIGLINTTALDDVMYALLTIDAFDPQSSVFASSENETHLGFNADVWPRIAIGANEAAVVLENALSSMDRSECDLHSANA